MYNTLAGMRPAPSPGRRYANENPSFLQCGVCIPSQWAAGMVESRSVDITGHDDTPLRSHFRIGDDSAATAIRHVDRRAALLAAPPRDRADRLGFISRRRCKGN